MSGRFLIAAAAALGVAGAAQAAFFPGQHPFGNITGTGTATVSPGSSGGTASWQDRDIDSTGFIAFPANPLLFYQETYNTPKTLTNVVVDTSDRDASGEVFVATTPGGPFTTSLGTFNKPNNAFTLLPSSVGSVFGVRIEVTGTTSNNLQIGGTEFWTDRTGGNIAAGIPGISSANAINFTAAAITDEQYAPCAWQSAENTTLNPEQFVGVEFPKSAVQGIRVTVAGPDGDQFGWKNFQVQVKQGGVWTGVGFASMGTNENIFWGTFDNPYDNRIEGIRLFGSNALGNNPTRSGGGLIVDEIQVFAPIPEPVSLGMVLLGGMAMVRRKR